MSKKPTFDEAILHVYQWHKGKYNTKAGYTLEDAVAVLGEYLQKTDKK